MSSRPFTTADARAHGVRMRRTYATDLSRPFHGIRLPVALGDSLLQRCSALAIALKADHFFSHTTAAQLYGLPLPPRLARSAILHVSSFRPTRPPRRAGVIGHRANRTRVSVRLLSGLPVALPAFAWCQLAPDLSLDELVAAGDGLLRMSYPLASHSAVRDAVEAYGQAHGSRRLKRALELLRPRVASPKETLLRLALTRSGLPEPEINTPIFDSTGHRIAIGDLVYPGFKVLVEYDGQQHRVDDTQYSRDVVRLNDLGAAGWLVLRVDKNMSLLEASARARAALLSRGWARPD